MADSLDCVVRDLNVNFNIWKEHCYCFGLEHCYYYVLEHCYCYGLEHCYNYKQAEGHWVVNARKYNYVDWLHDNCYCYSGIKRHNLDDNYHFDNKLPIHLKLSLPIMTSFKMIHHPLLLKILFCSFAHLNYMYHCFGYYFFLCTKSQHHFMKNLDYNRDHCRCGDDCFHHSSSGSLYVLAGFHFFV